MLLCCTTFLCASCRGGGVRCESLAAAVELEYYSWLFNMAIALLLVFITAVTVLGHLLCIRDFFVSVGGFSFLDDGMFVLVAV